MTPSDGQGTVRTNLSQTRAFIGREIEVKLLQEAFDATRTGQGGLIMVMGEPGIGKTAICEQLADYAALHGGRALTGHCYEEGSLSLSYLPFVEAIRSYALARDTDGLRSDLGNGADDIGRLVLEVRERVQAEPRPPGDPEDDRWRLLQSVAAFLTKAAQVQPLLIVLEDLHWADKGTLDLLLHVARNLAESRVMVLGTYRNVEVDRHHPLSGTLADLQRVDGFQRVPLRGLSTEDVQRMMSALAGQAVSSQTAEAIFRRTEGNPLFVQEVQRYLKETALIVPEDGRSRAASEGTRIPEGLRDVIGQRLAHLSAACNRVLAMAAVIGRDFELATLRSVSQDDEETVISAIEDAEKAGILEDRSGAASIRYRFAHALFRQTLYEELSAPRRSRLHQQVARTLEAQYARRLDDHSAELAEHFSNSGDPADLEKAVSYSQQAAERAASVFDYGEAERLLERAIDIQEVLESGDRTKRCDLLLQLGACLISGGNAERATDVVLEDAFMLALDLGSEEHARQACSLANFSLARFRRTVSPRAAQFARWLERATTYASPGSATEVEVLVQRAQAFLIEGRYGERYRTLQRALSLARSQQDWGRCFLVASSLIVTDTISPRHQATIRDLAIEASTWPRDEARVQNLSPTLGWIAANALGWGDRERAEAIWPEIPLLAARTKDSFVSSNVLFTDTLKAVLDGRLEEAIARAEEREAMNPVHGVLGRRLSIPPARYLGRTDIALALLDAYRSAPMETSISEDWSPERGIAVLLLAVVGDEMKASEGLRSAIAGFRTIGPLSDLPIMGLIHMLEAAVLLQDGERMAILVPELEAVSQMVNCAYLTCVARHLGDASVLLGKLEQARLYYEEALEVCARVRFRPELALSRLQLAELLLEHYPAEHSPALDHLDLAIAEFGEMKMQQALDRAVALRDSPRLVAAKAPLYPDGLSEREVKVLRLLAAAKSNRQIADELVISVNTVLRHVSSIFDKTGVINRTEAANYAHRNGLSATSPL